MNKAVKYGAVLIGIYLVVYNGSKSGRVIRAGSTGTRNIIEALQGRR